MKSFVSATIAALILAAPALSFAQQADHAPTRAEVEAELARLEAAGYRPAADHTRYPPNIQAAQRRVDQQQVVQTSAPVAAGFGSETRTATESGRPAMTSGRDALYRRH
ncbi:DUF4148 domain-containing protein [Burkholderia ubonensis]|uniref:DUF4148 domain-containing protein n=1 Tax=Burkholderia ubonensis subsp. mesacidophila TaxID=265293 RepID=A0A2A4EX69_9BURK|nr:DUF4148 domain-containing protein [Burkholderia ubonensis]PCE24746.1 hypothetical protein BZL54_32245 [Burkholderia ubonensis subsp. mesacidophila]